MKIAINKCYGGFGLSDKAIDLYNSLSDTKTDYAFEIERNDPILIQVIETLGDEANGRFAKLDIIDIPDDVEWEISEYDGMERVDEVHRSWY